MPKVPSRPEAKKFFDSLDVNGDGQIRTTELVDAMAENGYDKDAVLGWFAELDKDCDKKITCDEFTNEVCKKPRCEGVEEAFSAADADGSGKITFAEIESASAGAGLTDTEALKLGFAKMDSDGSGSVDKAEFIAYMNGNY